MAPLQAEFVVLADAKRGALMYDKRMFQRLSAQLKDGPYEIFVQRLRATRSLAANRFYWKVVIGAIADYTGYTPDETHEILKQMFLPKELALLDGNGDVVHQFVMGGSTRKLKVNEFNDYVRNVEKFASETLGIVFSEDGDDR